MSRYKKLISNSAIFFIGNLGSKVITFLLVPLYTHFLTTIEYGMIDLIVTTNQMLLPIVSLCIYDAVFRFILDKNEKTNISKLLSNAILITIMGNIILWMLYPLLSLLNIPFIGYMFLILFLQSLQTLSAQFIRSIGAIKDFAFNGIITSLILGISNVILLVYFNAGVEGYLISLIIMNIFSILFLCIRGNIYKYFSFKMFDLSLLKKMLLYSIPLIPNSFAWWINNASDRYALLFFVGAAANGIYAVATKIPSVLSMLNTIFFQSWQISAIEEYNSVDKGKFYSSTFSYYVQFMFLTASLVLVLLKPLSSLVSTAFSDFWKYAPFLLVGVIYSSFSSFLGTTYIAAKETKDLFTTTMLGAVINALLNVLLIPQIGIYGAGLATCISFFFIWIIRIRSTRKYLNITLNYKNLFYNHLVLFIQGLVLYITDNLIMYILELILLVCMIIINKSIIMDLFRGGMYQYNSIKKNKS